MINKGIIGERIWSCRRIKQLAREKQSVCWSSGDKVIVKPASIVNNFTVTTAIQFLDRGLYIYIKKQPTRIIKPCPFCGERGHKRTIKIESSLGGIKTLQFRRLIECRNPKCIQPSTWLHVSSLEWETVIDAWNKRSNEDNGF